MNRAGRYFIKTKVLEEAVTRIAALHKKAYDYCPECNLPYPCPTVKIIMEALGDQR